MSDSYKKSIEESKLKLRELVIQRDRIATDIERVKAVIKALAYMLDDSEKTSAEISEMEDILGPGGLTEAVRRTLQASTERGVTPVEVRDALANSGFDLSAYSNPLAAIHTILKRLVKAEDARAAIIDGDETVYQWKGIRRFPRLRQNGFIAQGLYGASKSLANTPDDILAAQASRAKK
jgi:hypothetical protein